MPNNGNSRKCAVRSRGTVIPSSMKRLFFYFDTFEYHEMDPLTIFSLERKGINCIAKDRKRRIFQKGDIRALGTHARAAQGPFFHLRRTTDILFFFLLITILMTYSILSKEERGER